MKDRFGVARCCCTSFCEDCCNGNAPTEWDMDIQFEDQHCSSCDDDLSGVFTLSRVSNQICRWEFQRISPTWSTPCDTTYSGYDSTVTYQFARLDVRCINETTYRITAFLQLQARYTSGTEVIGGVTMETRNMWRRLNATYVTDVAFDDFKCDEVVDFEVDLYSAFMYADFQYLFFPFPGSTYSYWETAMMFVQGSSINGTYSPLLLSDRPTTPKTYSLLNNMGTLNSWTDRPICDPPLKIRITGVP